MAGKFWTASWSPIVGCSPCSPGCDRCWALAMMNRFDSAMILTTKEAKELLDLSRYGCRWTGKHVLIERWLDKPLHWRKPRVVATGWLGDMWRDDVSADWIDAMLEIIGSAKQHQFLVLTKRSHNLNAKLYGADQYTPIRCLGGGDYHPNAWFGATVCNQPEADAQIPHLLRIPGKRWACVEPLLSAVVIPHIECLSFVVVGQETGPGARPARPEWIQGVIDQCHAASVPVWTKALPPGVEQVREAPEPIADILREAGMMEGT